MVCGLWFAVCSLRFLIGNVAKTFGTALKYFHLYKYKRNLFG